MRAPADIAFPASKLVRIRATGADAAAVVAAIDEAGQDAVRS
jgi:hypothetical protein